MGEGEQEIETPIYGRNKSGIKGTGQGIESTIL